MEDLIRKILDRIEETIDHDRIFDEKEAAEFLRVSPATLAIYRKKRLIAYAQYPQARSDRPSAMFTYREKDLIAFRDRYVVKSNGN